MQAYAAILIVFFLLFVFAICWVFFGKFVILKFAEYMANNQAAHEIEMAERAVKAEKRAAERAKAQEDALIEKEQKALIEAAAICPKCKVHRAPTAVSDITDYQQCCERHPIPAPIRVVPNHVNDVASTASAVE